MSPVLPAKRTLLGWLLTSLVAATVQFAPPATAAPSAAPPDDIVFPAEHWAEKSPAELGLDANCLEAVALALGGRGCIIKNGYVVKTWGSQSEISDWYSSAKPVLSTLLMFAIQEGKVESPDTRIAKFGWELSAKDQPMTFRHLGAMTSGYARPEAPGAAWSYNDYAIQLYQKTLFDRVYQAPPEEVVTAPDRFGALGLEDGLEFRPSNRRISASVRDFGRIAWLWLNRGRWNDRQLIGRELFDECQRPQVPIDLPNTVKAPTDDYLHIGTYGGESDHFSQAGPGVYGFNWWFNATPGGHPGERAWPDAPADTYMSLGLRGNCTAMMPDLKLLVVCAMGDWGPNQPAEPQSVMNQRLRLIAYAGTPVVDTAGADKPADKAGPESQKPAPLPDDAIIVQGERRKWHDITITFRGPRTSESATPNPFLDYRLDVAFFFNGNRMLTVPGYFAADGQAAETGATEGDRWRVHFVPGMEGPWEWQATFRQGRGVAIADTPQAADAVAFDGAKGTLMIGPADKNTAGFIGQGRLRYIGERDLRFEETQKYFLKNGADSPENLLAFADFDDTKPTHRFEPHALDARPDDPTWRGGRGRNLLGAMNYLASKGVNSIYFLPMNVRGDGKDVWPWTDAKERFRFDCSKLDQWEIFFSHLERRASPCTWSCRSRRTTSFWTAARWGPSGGCISANWSPVSRIT